MPLSEEILRKAVDGDLTLGSTVSTVRTACQEIQRIRDLLQDYHANGCIAPGVLIRKIEEIVGSR